jgi:membrane protein implicated in regulation of membrane protease activity
VFTTETPALAWLALAIVAAIVEVSIPHFGVMFVSIGAVAAAIAAVFGFDLAVQLVVFAAALTLSLLLLRERLLKQMGGRGVPSRTDHLIGREGIVTHDLDATVGAGRVNVGGEDWAARATTPLAAGTRIRVIAADGIVLEVKPA